MYQCVVEVCDDTEACETFFVDKECKPLSSSALKSQQKQELKECDAISLLHRSRSSWAASAAEREEQEEDMTTQRRRQKGDAHSLCNHKYSSRIFSYDTEACVTATVECCSCFKCYCATSRFHIACCARDLDTSPLRSSIAEETPRDYHNS